MKQRKNNYEKFFGVGVIFIAVGATFMISVNVGLGATFIALGVLFILRGAREKQKGEGKKTK